MRKYIFVTGGVCSSLGKGVTAASIASLLEGHGYRIALVKIDPYINVDAGTMNPYQHGEVYVTDDGSETDLDLGNYERFVRQPVGLGSITTGQIYAAVIQREREGDYLGRTVQVIPHITDQIIRRIDQVGAEGKADITIIEVGGTVGDIESIPFLEAARQMIHEHGHTNVLSAHLTLIPEVSGGDLKTKPTQHSVKELRELGIQPDILLCRSPVELTEALRYKIASFTNVDTQAVISAPNVRHIVYELPIVLQRQQLDEIMLAKLHLEPRIIDMSAWKQVVQTYSEARDRVRIALIGKYTELADAYKSVDEALIHGGVANNVGVELTKIESGSIEDTRDAEQLLVDVDGVLIPGGFGIRGVEGMVTVAGYARRRGIPYFGICLGMHVMVIEYARSVLKLNDANSSEFASNLNGPDNNLVIVLLEDQIDVKDYGGTMRLGRSPSRLKRNTEIHSIYNQGTIYERHRHRYEVANSYRTRLQESGLIIAAVTPDDELVEAVQWPDHPWGIGVQFHPEFKSKPFEAHPLFAGFIAAALRHKRNQATRQQTAASAQA